jgi:hypothetical protein
MMMAARMEGLASGVSGRDASWVQSTLSEHDTVDIERQKRRDGKFSESELCRRYANGWCRPASCTVWAT